MTQEHARQDLELQVIYGMTGSRSISF